VATYYIDYSPGDDSTGAGSSGNPWKTIQKAIDNSTGGDVIKVANTAAEVFAAAITWNTGFGGTNATSHLVIESWDNGGSITVTLPDLTTATGFEWDGNSAVSTFWSVTSLPGYVTIKGGVFHGSTGSMGITGSSWMLRDCEVYSNPGTDMIRVGQYSTITNCYFRDSGGSGVDGVNLSGVGCFLTGSRIENCTGKGVYTSSSGSVIDGNVIEGNSETHVFLVTSNVRVTNNTINGKGASQPTNTHGVETNHLSYDNLIITDNLVTNFGGTSCVGVKTVSGASIKAIGSNGFYSNTSDYSIFSIGLDLRASDVDETSDPYTDAASGDFSLVSGALSIDAKAGALNDNIGGLQADPAGGAASMLRRSNMRGGY